MVNWLAHRWQSRAPHPPARYHVGSEIGVRGGFWGSGLDDIFKSGLDVAEVGG
jgi:hypothetical protein